MHYREERTPGSCRGEAPALPKQHEGFSAADDGQILRGTTGPEAAQVGLTQVVSAKKRVRWTGGCWQTWGATGVGRRERGVCPRASLSDGGRGPASPLTAASQQS